MRARDAFEMEGQMNAEPNARKSDAFPPVGFGINHACELIRELRVDLGFTQAELARLAGVSQSALSEIETGAQRNPKPETLLRLEKALGLAPRVLVTGFEDDRAQRRAEYGADESVALEAVRKRLRATLVSEENLMRDYSKLQSDYINAAITAGRWKEEFCLLKDRARQTFWRGAVTGAAAMLTALCIAVLAVLL